MNLQTLGDRAVTVTFGSDITPECNARVTSFCHALKTAALSGVLEWVPSYAAVTVHYDPEILPFESLQRKLNEIKPEQAELSRGGLLILPVCYGGEYGPDLAAVATHCGMTEDEIVAIHSGREYLVYMLGFMPGFPYLGGMDPSIATPRLKTPRTAIPAGSVGIAGKQTGVYPLPSPGGWQLIGRTPLKLFDALRTPQNLLSAGMHVQFRPIFPEEFLKLEASHD